MDSAKVIKSIWNRNHGIELFEVNKGYTVNCHVLGREIASEVIPDLKTAFLLFDLKFQEIEGN